MLEKNTIRTMGIIMIIVANMFFILSMLFSGYSGGRVYSDSHIGILFLYSPYERFSESEYRGLFSGMGIDTFFIRDDGNISADDLEEEILYYAQNNKLESVILLAHGRTAQSALRLRADIDYLRGIILLFPEHIEEGANHYLVPTQYDYVTGVFGVKNHQAIDLYERLSGEDATLTPPLSGGRWITPEIRIPPDANVYFCAAEYTGNEDLDRYLISMTPHLRQKMSAFIQDYLMHDDDRIVDARGVILMQYASEFIPLTILISGFLFFLSTVQAGSPIKVVKPKDPERESQKPNQLTLHSKIGRSEKYLFGFLLPMGFAWTVFMIIIMLTNIRLLPYVVVGWTLFSVITASIFYLKHLRNLGAMPKPNPKRMSISAVVSLLVLSGIFLHVVTHLSSLSRFLFWPRNLVVIVFAVIFVLGLVVCQKIDMYYTYNERTAYHRRGFLSAWRFRGLVLMPFILLLVASFLTAKVWVFAVIVFYIASLLIADIFRQIIKRVSGASVLPAFVGALLYVILILV